MKIKLFTHTDLDGIGCAILSKYVFGDTDIEYCNYDKIDERVELFLNNKDYKNYDMIFITDISINDKLAQKIDKLSSNKFIILDHHPTADFLNKYDWCFVRTGEKEQEKSSGTSMFYEFLIYENYFKGNNEYLEEFVNKVKHYDTWDWKILNDIKAKQLNDLFFIYGQNYFINSMLENINNKYYFDFTETENLILGLEERKISEYVNSKNNEIIVKDILGYKAGIIFGEQYHSEVGNELCALHPELDFIVIINMSKAVSYRSIGNKVDLGKDVAKVYGGGGHINSAGSQISDEIKNKLIDMIFDK